MDFTRQTAESHPSRWTAVTNVLYHKDISCYLTRDLRPNDNLWKSGRRFYATVWSHHQYFDGNKCADVGSDYQNAINRWRQEISERVTLFLASQCVTVGEVKVKSSRRVDKHFNNLTASLRVWSASWTQKWSNGQCLTRGAPKIFFFLKIWIFVRNARAESIHRTERLNITPVSPDDDDDDDAGDSRAGNQSQL